MPAVRILTGERPGTIVEVAPEVAQALIATNRAELVEPEKPETPEASKRRRSRRPETRNLETR